MLNKRKRVYISVKLVEVGKEDFSIDDFISSNNNREEKEILNLGIAPLQKIVNQMKNMKYQSQSSKKFDPAAARALGLPTYCEYLTNANSSL